jgi:hypothetical protein
MLKQSACAIAVALTLAAASASAANVSASMTVAQSDGSSWVENLSGLVVTDAQNNFAMVQGTGTTGYFQNGQFVTAAQTGSHPDYWQWNAATASWNWHTAQTLDGSMPSTIADPANPWQSTVNLQNFSGHGDPDMIYAVSAINNNTLTQTYTFTFGESIAPTVSGPNSTYADVSGGLTSRSGNVGGATITPVNASGVQQFELSADNGMTFVNAGVDVGQAANAASSSTYGLYAANNGNGPTGQTWNYMRLVSSFTLSGKSAASLAGFASITPVPEPQVGSMLLLGIGLIGTMVHRRRNLWT